MFFTSQFDNNNASMFIEDDEEEQDDYFTQKIKKDDSDEFSDLDSDDGFWSDEDPVPTQQATQIPESDKLTMMIEERFSTQNSVNFDRKYADRLRVFVKGGQGGNG